MSEAKYLKPSLARTFIETRWRDGDLVRQACIAVGQAWDMAPEHILSSDRARTFSEARHAAFLLARDVTGRSWPQLGKLFRRHHSSVMVGARKAQRLAEENERYASRLQLAREAMGAA